MEPHCDTLCDRSADVKRCAEAPRYCGPQFETCLFPAAHFTLVEQASLLLSQQIWCWGRDILHPEGNHLCRIGFVRLPPPIEQHHCSSVYQLELGEGRFLVLRGFGIYFGDEALGGVYLTRYSFFPRYSSQARLPQPCWAESDLPMLLVPGSDRREPCLRLLLSLLDWIRGYETDVARTLGEGYRHATLARWDNGERLVIPAYHMAAAWRRCMQLIPYQLDPWGAQGLIRKGVCPMGDE